MNAIILAAGLGTRLDPISRHTPKPLLKISGQPIIERQIQYLRERNITEIYIVVGHLHQQFTYLKSKYDVKLILNHRYREFNNIYSMFLAKDYFGDTLVLEGDVFLNTNFLEIDLKRSTYFTGLKKRCQNEWILDFDNDKLIAILLPDASDRLKKYNEGAYILSGVSFWNKKDAAIIRTVLEHVIYNLVDVEIIYKNWYWDNIVVENIKQFSIGIKKIASDAWLEVDYYEDILFVEN